MLKRMCKAEDSLGKHCKAIEQVKTMLEAPIDKAAVRPFSHAYQTTMSVSSETQLRRFW